MNGCSVVDAAAFPACLLDRTLRYRRANAAWDTSLRGEPRRPGDPVIGAAGGSFLLDLPPDRRPHWRTALRDIVAGRLGHYLDQTVEQHGGGEHVLVTTANPWIGASGMVDGVLCLRYDLTDARRGAAIETALTEVLVAARRLQHFLGNQLALTLGYVELMTLDSRLPPDLRERVDEALRGVVEATETLSRLRKLTRRELAPDDPSIAAEYARPLDVDPDD
jgi:hypothetical protein